MKSAPPCKIQTQCAQGESERARSRSFSLSLSRDIAAGERCSGAASDQAHPRPSFLFSTSSSSFSPSLSLFFPNIKQNTGRRRHHQGQARRRRQEDRQDGHRPHRRHQKGRRPCSRSPRRRHQKDLGRTFPQLIFRRRHPQGHRPLRLRKGRPVLPARARGRLRPWRPPSPHPHPRLPAPPPLEGRAVRSAVGAREERRHALCARKVRRSHARGVPGAAVQGRGQVDALAALRRRVRALCCRSSRRLLDPGLLDGGGRRAGCHRRRGGRRRRGGVRGGQPAVGAAEVRRGRGFAFSREEKALLISFFSFFF